MSPSMENFATAATLPGSPGRDDMPAVAKTQRVPRRLRPAAFACVRSAFAVVRGDLRALGSTSAGGGAGALVAGPADGCTDARALDDLRARARSRLAGGSVTGLGVGARFTGDGLFANGAFLAATVRASAGFLGGGGAAGTFEAGRFADADFSTSRLAGAVFPVGSAFCTGAFFTAVFDVAIFFLSPLGRPP